ncbi:hypothetical protein QT231_14360 [Halomonas sp. SpR1]|uniref:hypothetical protein n=1 Tax=Halomonas sp. SpR1 TaxID=3050462 RepID=UPI0027E5ADDB|nr:hypothetical protein [Halomonas sp. SpR1]MDQ7733892.1 hypothetical protein [Halomonas sp. SpR1]
MARKHTHQRRHRQTSKTALLIVGEGPDDQAFVKHMHQQFRTDYADIKPTIEKQSGGSPGNIITNATRKYGHLAFDQRFLVLDADVPPTQQDRDKAIKHDYKIILWSPTCLEGALLDVLGEGVNDHETAQQLKSRLHPRLAGTHTQSAAYAVLFPRAVLQASENISVNTVRNALAGQLT